MQTKQRQNKFSRYPQKFSKLNTIVQAKDSLLQNAAQNHQVNQINTEEKCFYLFKMALIKDDAYTEERDAKQLTQACNHKQLHYITTS